MKGKTIHVIPHTHWDREWYFNTSRSTIYLLKHIKEVMEVLENDPDYRSYILDGQSSLLDDYLAYYPEDKERLSQLITDHRLYTGPWYTQTDQLVISQESVVRNLFYGRRLAESLGHSMAIGYVPDPFGQGGNMPQIYKGFGISNFLFWRGVADTTFKEIQFIWKGADGSTVTANNFRHGYNYGGEYGCPEASEDLEAYLDNFPKLVAKESNTDHVYFPYGHDQAPIRENLPELVEKMNALDPENTYKMGDPEQFFEDLNREKDQLPVLEGELTQGKHSRVHKTIFSTRADLKQKNNDIENYVVNTLEPVLLIGEKLGMDYPHQIVEKIWKLLLKNAAHDSIGGCNSDGTNRDVAYRYKVANDLATSLLERSMRTIANRIQSTAPLLLTIFNPLPESYSGLVEIEAYLPSLDFALIDEETGKAIPYVLESYKDMTDYVLKQTIKIDASQEIYVPEKVYQVQMKVDSNELTGLGYRSYRIEPASAQEKTTYETDRVTHSIENAYYVIQLNEDNSLSILEKATGKSYSDQMIFVDQGDDGDSYNYSPPRKDNLLQSSEAKRGKVEALRSELNEALIINLTMTLPKDLKERAEKKVSVEVPLRVRIDLEKANPVIHFQVDVDNKVLSHKLSVLFKSGIPSQWSYADQLFGSIQRPIHLPEMAIWERDKWEEAPISIEPMQSYCGLGNDRETYALLTGGIREYEVVGDQADTLKLTLFRTFSHMGKENLLYRPGRASGEAIVETPEAQLLGKISCRFALYINGLVGIESVNLSRYAKRYLTTIPSYLRADFLNGRLIFSQKRESKIYPSTCSFLNFDGAQLGISCVKGHMERPKATVLRLFNPYPHQTIQLPVELKDWQGVQLDEVTACPNQGALTKNKFVTLIKEE